MAVGRGFFLCSPGCPKQPETSFPFYKIFYPTISGRISVLTSSLPDELNGLGVTCEEAGTTVAPQCELAAAAAAAHCAAAARVGRQRMLS